MQTQKVKKVMMGAGTDWTELNWTHFFCHLSTSSLYRLAPVLIIIIISPFYLRWLSLTSRGKQEGRRVDGKRKIEREMERAEALLSQLRWWRGDGSWGGLHREVEEVRPIIFCNSGAKLVLCVQ